MGVVVDFATRQVRPATLFRDLDPEAQRRVFRRLQQEIAEIVARDAAGTPYHTLNEAGGSGGPRHQRATVQAPAVIAFGRYLARLDPNSRLRELRAVAVAEGIVVDIGGPSPGGGGRVLRIRGKRQRMVASPAVILSPQSCVLMFSADNPAIYIAAGPAFSAEGFRLHRPR